MIVEPTEIKEVITITPARFGDDRGYFSEVYNEKKFAEATELDVSFVQDNESLSAAVGTLRGLHFQTAPFAQGKLVRVLAGRLLDIAVDIRKSSPTFGHHVAVELDAETGKQLWVPEGFAHGFVTLAPNTILSYKVTDFYNPQADRSLLWNDPALQIEWPVTSDKVQLSEKDRTALKLEQLKENGDLSE